MNNMQKLSASVSTHQSQDYYAPRRYFEIDTPFIAAHQWPYSLIELALSRGVEEHKLLRNTGIFCADIAGKKLYLSPQQCFQLINNVQKHIHSNDLSFLLGHRFFSDTQNAAADALNSATNLQDAIDTLMSNALLLTPLLNVHCWYEQERVVIYWQDTCGAESSVRFLIEMLTTALSSLARWHSGESWPWQFYFAHNKPAYIEQYDVHLNNNVQFSCQVNAMAIARDYLYLPWKNSADQLIPDYHAGDQQSQPLDFEQGFLAEIYTYLQKNIQLNSNLEQTAADFGMSSASLKRKLKKHHSHFQAQYDLARRDLAIMWLSQEGLTNEQVAQKLHFYDAANLRRAFKKWTGKLPHPIQKMI